MNRSAVSGRQQQRRDGALGSVHLDVSWFFWSVDLTYYLAGQTFSSVPN